MRSNAIALDDLGGLYIAGEFNDTDAYVAKFNSNGVYSSYFKFGGTGLNYEVAWDIATHTAVGGEIYVYAAGEWRWSSTLGEEIDFDPTPARIQGVVPVSTGVNMFVGTYQSFIPVNNVPVAVNDTGNVAEGGTLTVGLPGVLGNDSDVDNDPLTVTVIPVNGPTNGTLILNTDGSYRYVHDGSETTSDSFVYQVSDGNGGVGQGTVTLTITPINDLPIANAGPDQATNEGALYSLNGSASSDSDGAITSYAWS